METKWGPVWTGLVLLLCLSCGRAGSSKEAELSSGEGGAGYDTLSPGLPGTGEPAYTGEGLDEIAEIERTGRFFQGMGLAESTIREDAGDYGGAVIAAYKELAWTYGYGGIGREEMEEGLGRVLDLYRESGEEPLRQRVDTIRAARGALAFMGGRWEESADLLGIFAEAEEEPDAFSRWMLLVCALEGGEQSRKIRSAYGAIRARYERFPEYWYRGARSLPGTLAAEYAERCINLSPKGPFAEECRGIIARGMGLPDGAPLKSKAEIEEIISRSAASGQPEVLAELFPLISLPDNAYTLYALGALRALAASPPFRDFFTAESARSTGRLAERLVYVSRG